MKRFVMLTLSTICLLAFVAPSVATPLQTPPEEQNPWLCYDDVGWERPCTATEEYRRCLDASMVAFGQCLSRSGPAGDVVCWWAFTLDQLHCAQDILPVIGDQG